MLFSTNLLKSWTTLPGEYKDINYNLIAKLFEIEHGETQRTLPELLLIGKVTDVKKHPNADTLFVCQVDCGSHGNFQICTGGENVASGQFVPTAIPGCYLPAIDLSIGSRKMRGEESNGMICSKEELGINEDQDKHWIWDMTQDLHCNDTMIGKTMREVFPWMENTIFEVESVAITNRADLRGHVGLAIEARSIFSDYTQSTDTIHELIKNAQEFSLANIESLPSFTQIDTPQVKTAKCSYYSISEIDNTINSQSVFAGRVSLLDLGHTPRRNRVDYGNYFMSNYGQPIHIFDKDKISGGIIVKEAEGGEVFVDLNGKEHSLLEGDIIICDTEKILALAGIMGGINSAFSEDTKSIAIEIAHFDPIQIRKTSTRLGLKTDAAVRYEKGINPMRTAFCVWENNKVLTKNNEEHNTGTITNIRHNINGLNENKKTLTLDIKKTTHYLQGSYNETIANQIPEILTRLGYEVTKSLGHYDTKLEPSNLVTSAPSDLVITAPIRRADIQIIQDIYEDLARHIGLDMIPEIPSSIQPSRSQKTIVDFQHSLSNTLINNCKFSQVECYPRYGESWINHMNLDKENHFELLNPTDVATPFMAQSLLPGLLDLVKKNYKFTLPIKVFEVGKVFRNEGHENGSSMVVTKKVIACVYADRKNKERTQDPYLEMKKVLSIISKEYGIPKYTMRVTDLNYLHPSKQSQILYNDVIIGSLSQIHPSLLDALGLQEDIIVSYLKINIEALFPLVNTKPKKTYHSNQDQFFQRDLSFEIETADSFDQIMNIFAKSKDIDNYEVIDLYKPEGASRKSIAIRFTIIGDSSMGNELVTEITNNIITEVEATGAVLKGVKA